MNNIKQWLIAVSEDAPFAGLKATPKQKPGDQVQGDDAAIVTRKGEPPFKGRLVGNENILPELSKIAERTSLARKLQEQLDSQQIANPIDTITMDVPLFIRMLEYSREDAKTDMDLHHVLENILNLQKSTTTLTMKDYNDIVNIHNQITEYGNAQDPNVQSTNANKQSSTKNDNADNPAVQAKADAAVAQKNVNQLKALNPALNTDLTGKVVNKLNQNSNITSGPEIQQANALADMLASAIKDPRIGSQVTNLLKQAGKK